MTQINVASRLMMDIEAGTHKDAQQFPGSNSGKSRHSQAAEFAFLTSCVNNLQEFLPVFQVIRIGLVSLIG
jgi:hypothetical protein